MIKFKFTSLTMRIWFILSLVIITLVLVISLVFTFIMANFNENKYRELLQYSHEWALQTVHEYQLNPTESDQVDHHEHIQHFTFDKKQGDIHFITESDKEHDQSLFVWISRFIEDNPNNDNRASFKKSINNRTYLIEISHVEDQVYLISYGVLSKEEQVVQIFSASLLVLLCSLPIAMLIAHNIAKPLKQLEGYTKRIANKEWNSEIDLKDSDEIGRLASAMNDMKHALKQADEEEKKFLQTISHDLKTPVMVIMSYAQAIIDGLYVDSAENTAMIIKEEAIRLEKKIKQILYLNTLDYALENEKEQEEIYLDKILTYLVHNFQAINTDLSWQLNIENKPALVLGNPDRIRVSIENILENQLRYAAKTIEVNLQEDHSFWMIEIKNDGPLIPEKDVNKIFKNLYKGDNGNFGLGLTISKKIISFYHGSIKVENRDDHVCFTICYLKKE